MPGLSARAISTILRASNKSGVATTNRLARAICAQISTEGSAPSPTTAGRCWAQRLHRLASALDHHHRHLPRQQRIGNARAYRPWPTNTTWPLSDSRRTVPGSSDRGSGRKGQLARPAVARAQALLQQG